MDFMSTYLSFQSSYNSVLKAYNVLKLFVYNHVRRFWFIWPRLHFVIWPPFSLDPVSTVFPALYPVSSEITSCAFMRIAWSWTLFLAYQNSRFITITVRAWAEEKISLHVGRSPYNLGSITSRWTSLPITGQLAQHPYWCLVMQKRFQGPV